MTAGGADFHIYISNLGGEGRGRDTTATSTVKRCISMFPIVIITLSQLEINTPGDVPLPHRVARKWRI